MRSGENHHRGLVGVVVRNHLIHVEEVSVAVTYDIGTEAVDSILEVEVNGVACTYAEAGVAALFGGARSDVAGAEVTEGGIAALEVEVAVFVGDISGFFLAGADGFGIFFFLGNPDAAVVAE